MEKIEIRMMTDDETMLEVAFICFLSFCTVWFGYIFLANWWKFFIQQISSQELEKPLQYTPLSTLLTPLLCIFYQSSLLFPHFTKKKKKKKKKKKIGNYFSQHFSKRATIRFIVTKSFNSFWLQRYNFFSKQKLFQELSM